MADTSTFCEFVVLVASHTCEELSCATVSTPHQQLQLGVETAGVLDVHCTTPTVLAVKWIFVVQVACCCRNGHTMLAGRLVTKCSTAGRRLCPQWGELR